MDDPKDQSAFDQMAAALNDHQVTDEEGQLAEGTATEDTASQETNTKEEIATPEKAQESEDLSSQDESEDDEIPAVDDLGKRYIPEKRFKKETAKRREAERLAEQKAKEAEALKALISNQTPDKVVQTGNEPQPDSNLDRLELRMVFKDYPQFNPTSEEYNQDLDALAGDIRRANPSMSVSEAAEKAISFAKKLSSDQIKVAREARAVKAQQSDQGITSRVLQRSGQTPDPDKMTLEEKEEWLRDNGMW